MRRLWVVCCVIWLGCSAPERCDASTCATGCCDGAGQCRVPSAFTCGTAGSTCGICAAGQTCADGVCATPRFDAGPAPLVLLHFSARRVIDSQLSGELSVEGCAVDQVELIENGSVVAEVPFMASPQAFSIPEASFAPVFARMESFPVSMQLAARVRCTDGTVATSSAEAVSFFPVVERIRDAHLPLGFVAEGGSTPTFLGCRVGSIARIERTGQSRSQVLTMPFACTEDTEISPAGGGYRWVRVPGVGAFALRLSDLTVGKVIRGTVKRLGVSPSSGVAVALVDAAVHRLDPSIDATHDWSHGFDGFMNAAPRFIENGGAPSVWLGQYLFDLGANRGHVVASHFDLSTGALLDATTTPEPLLEQIFPSNASFSPVFAEAAFSGDGQTLVVPLVAPTSSGPSSTTVFACATVGGCDGPNRRWTSSTFPETLGLTVATGDGAAFMVSGPSQIWALASATGTVASAQGPLFGTNDGKIVSGLVAGEGRATYVSISALTTEPTPPREVVAFDDPLRAAVWRLSDGSPLALNVAPDGTPWVAIGPDLLRLFSTADSRARLAP